MAYRQKHVTTEGRAELFLTRLDDDAFEGWLRERSPLAAAGHPDRPPDVWMPTIRMWLPHPGEEAHDYFRAHADYGAVVEAEHEGAFPVLAVSWHDGDRRTRLYLVGYGDGAYTERVAVDDLRTGEQEHEVEVPVPAFAGDDEVDEHLQRGLEMIGDVAGPTGLVTLPSDFEEAADAVAAAQADIAEAFGTVGSAARA